MNSLVFLCVFASWRHCVAFWNLIGKVITVSLETVEIVESLPALRTQ